MKKILLTSGLILMFIFQINAADLSPFIDCGVVSGEMKTVKESIKTKLKDKGFIITGGYYVENKGSLYVLTFSSNELRSVCLKVKDRGLLAANLRIGLIKKGDKIHVTALNPKYLFVGYLGDSYSTYKEILTKVDNNVKSVLKKIKSDYSYFGGKVAESKLGSYHYMMGMPYFDDPVELKEFDSFEQAVATIKKNLEIKKGGTRMVYKLVYKTKKVAVFGVALHNKTKGEASFLPIVGETHLAAMPYEIIIQDKTATILHGRYRFAFYWPELSMGTFTKIMSAPGEIEEMMKALTE